MNPLFVTLSVIVVTRGIRITDEQFEKSWVGEVKYIDRLKPSELWSSFFNTSIPVKTSLPELLKVRELWTNDYMAGKFGHVKVRTEPTKENRTTDYCGMERKGRVINCNSEDLESARKVHINMKLEDFLGNSSIPGFDRYVISMLDDSMAFELPFLASFSCGLKRKYFQVDKPNDELHATQIYELNFWLSSGGSHSTLHYDMNHQIMCQIDGKKEWRFWDLRTEQTKIPMWSEFYSNEYRSDDAPIDPLNADLESFPEFLNANWTNTTLNAGECLLIPSYHWLHYVSSPSYERNMAFSVHVSPMMIEAKSHIYDCDEDVKNISASSLGKFNVTIPFPGDVRESGYNTVRMGHPDWKDLALHALKQLVVGKNLQSIISEMTFGRSDKSKRIPLFFEDLPQPTVHSTYLMAVFNHGALWREVSFLMN